jgi:hypothetical protein
MIAMPAAPAPADRPAVAPPEWRFVRDLLRDLHLAMSEHTAEELAQQGLQREVAQSIVRDLRNSLDEWHGQVQEKRVRKLTATIFQASSADAAR